MKIALCVPCYDGRVHDAHMASVLKTFRLAAARGIEILLITGRGSPILPDIRNWCVAMALTAGCDKVWFVDSDIGWENSIEAALNMITAPVDIVCGVHQKRNTTWNAPAELVVRWGQIPPPEDPETGLWEVERVATAFLCVDRRVFERLADAGIARNYLPHGGVTTGDHYKWYRNYFWYAIEPSPIPQEAADHLDAIGYDGPRDILIGEDFYFCQRAKEVGARIFVDPRVELVHFDGCVQHNVSLKNVKFEVADASPADHAASAEVRDSKSRSGVFGAHAGPGADLERSDAA